MNSSRNWDLQISPSVSNVLASILRRDAQRILGIIRLLPLDPYFGDIKKMKGEEDVWRRRVGSYRIFYRLKATQRVILVFHLERRTSKTYR